MSRHNKIYSLIEEMVSEALESNTPSYHYVSENPTSSERKKYPRTFHLPWSQGATDDDKTHDEATIEKMFAGKEVVVTEKLDGENTSIYSDGSCHARSRDSISHPSRTYVKAKAAQIGCDLPQGWRLVGENLYGQHSIAYNELSDYFVLFGIVDDKNQARPWDEVEEWAQLLEIPHVPVVWRGVWDPEKIQSIYPFDSKMGGQQTEGYVVRIADTFPMDDFSHFVAKFVRKNHVETDEHWMSKPVVPNKLRKEVALDEKRVEKDNDEKRDRGDIPLTLNFKGQWVRPEKKHILDQVELAACLNNLDYNKLFSEINQTSPSELDKHTWANLENTNSFRAGNVDLAKELADQYGYHYNDALFGYMNDRDITMPVILDINDGEEFYAVSGEPELLFARAFKVTPQVLIMKI